MTIVAVCVFPSMTSGTTKEQVREVSLRVSAAMRHPLMGANGIHLSLPVAAVCQPTEKGVLAWTE